MHRLAILVAFAAACAAGENGQAPTSIGFRGDGTGAHPGANPPVEWDGKQESAYRWRFPLPTHGYGCPIVVQGRVIAVSENDAEHPYPMVTCVDVKTGKQLWQRELDHVPVAVKDAARAKQIDAVWRKHLKFTGDIGELRRKWEAAKGKSEEERLALKQDFQAMGFEGGDELLLASRFKTSYNWPMKIVGPPASELMYLKVYGKNGTHNELAEANLWVDFRRRRGIENIWDTFPTPVSDGERIFIMNAFDAYWCVDLDGKTLWCNWYPRDHGGDDCQNGRSPILWHDFFIADNRRRVRAFDRKTGKLAWEYKKAGTHEICSPVVVTVSGEDYVWFNGSPRGVLRCRDGKHFPIEGWKSTGMMVAVDTDSPDTVYMSGGGEHGGYHKKAKGDERSPAGIRLSLNGEKMKAAVLWMGIGGDPEKGNYPGNNGTIAYHRGKLYYDCKRGGFILDPATGKILAGQLQRKGRQGAATPGTKIALLFAADRVYGFTKAPGKRYKKGQPRPPPGPMAEGLCEVYDLAGKRLASNIIRAPWNRDGRNCRFAIGGVKLSYPYTFTIDGDAIVFRSCWDLTCVGR